MDIWKELVELEERIKEEATEKRMESPLVSKD